MEVHLTPDQDVPLQHLGKEPGQMVIEAVLHMIEQDARVRAAVRKGIEHADRGEFVDEAEMEARLERMLQR